MSQRIYRQKGSRPRPREYETAADVERAEKAKVARKRALRVARAAEAFIDHTIWDGR